LSKRRMRNIVKYLALVIAVILLSGMIYEQLGRWQDRKRLPQIGRSVDIGGRTLNISCAGSGGPAVIFESGGDAPGLGWELVQAEAAKFTQACWYDRAGIGWSDPGPYPRTSAAIAEDLHGLLKQAGVPAPYVLAGGSFGGLNSRVYSGLYPNEVAGMVLVDAADEDEPLRAPKCYLARTAPRWLWRPLHLTYEAAARIGVLRLIQSSAPQSKSPSQMTRDEIIAALRRQPKSVVNNASTGIVLPESYDEARSSGSLGDRPLIVLTAGQPWDFRDPELNRQAAAYQQIWIHEMQARQARLSSRGRQIVVENSHHSDIPDQVVVKAIGDVIDQVRRAGQEN
jgi:pimeloyl-ACP methyl ester carboxylesterase